MGAASRVASVLLLASAFKLEPGGQGRASKRGGNSVPCRQRQISSVCLREGLVLRLCAGWRMRGRLVPVPPGG